jgi:D-glucosaminate-6-phosphate ammonia-lyase
MDILERLSSIRVVNAAGPVTRLGGSLLETETLEAMAIAARLSLDMGELQGVASEVISTYTGAEAGIVTSGAMAGLLVGAAACMTGFDLSAQARLPDVTGLRHEFIVPRSHRNSFDRGVRATGARLVDVGLVDRLNGCGPRDTELWEIESAITERTAGILYLARADARPDLAAVARLAHAARLPVLVDAAAELPPVRNLKRFIEEGADLVVFSGGKALQGPSSSGVLCGRRPLVGAALLHQIDLGGDGDWQPPAQLIHPGDLSGMPRHGIGRACKVGKEQIVGALTALTRFCESDEEARNRTLAAIASAVAGTLSELATLRVRVVADEAHGGTTWVEVALDGGLAQPTATHIASRLRAGRPPVHVNATHSEKGILLLGPQCLTAGDEVLIRAAFVAALATGP